MLMFAYFIGIALVGAGLGALVAHVVWTQVGTGDPPAVGDHRAVDRSARSRAMFLQRYVIIVATAFGGAWTMIVGGARDRRRSRRRAGGVGRRTCGFCIRRRRRRAQRWVPIAWIVLGLIGTGRAARHHGTEEEVAISRSQTRSGLVESGNLQLERTDGDIRTARGSGLDRDR